MGSATTLFNGRVCRDRNWQHRHLIFTRDVINTAADQLVVDDGSRALAIICHVYHQHHPWVLSGSDFEPSNDSTGYFVLDLTLTLVVDVHRESMVDDGQSHHQSQGNC